MTNGLYKKELIKIVLFLIIVFDRQLVKGEEERMNKKRKERKKERERRRRKKMTIEDGRKGKERKIFSA